jgi:hypothetical protein
VAILGVVLLIIAAALELTSKHLDLVIWLVIFGAMLIGAEVVWVWNRAGRYGRRI